MLVFPIFSIYTALLEQNLYTMCQYFNNAREYKKLFTYTFVYDYVIMIIYQPHAAAIAAFFML